MTIRDMVSAYVLADMTIASLLGTRLYPELPQKLPYPAAKLFRVDTVRPPTLRSVSALPRARLQFDLYCDGNGAAAVGYTSSIGVVNALEAALRVRLDGFGWKADAEQYLFDTSMSPALPIRAWIRIDTEESGVEPTTNGGLSEVHVDYFVDYQSHAGVY